MITWNKNVPAELQSANAALGLCGESAELISLLENQADTQKCIEEVGDLLYYVAVATCLLGTNLEHVITYAPQATIPPQKILYTIVTAAGTYAEHIKKYTFHGHDLKTCVLKEALSQLFHAVSALVLSLNLNITVDEIMDANIKKLAARYPNQKFDAEHSRNRTE